MRKTLRASLLLLLLSCPAYAGDIPNARTLPAYPAAAGGVTATDAAGHIEIGVALVLLQSLMALL